jgi:hypothetical protein
VLGIEPSDLAGELVYVVPELDVLGEEGLVEGLGEVLVEELLRGGLGVLWREEGGQHLGERAVELQFLEGV